MLLTGVNVFLILLIAYAQWRMPDAVGPTVPFGVRIPAERKQEPVVLQAKRLYRMILMPLAAAALAAALLVQGAAPGYAALPAVGFIALMYVDYYLMHRMLRAAKERGRWYQGRRTAAVADTGPRAEPVRFPLQHLYGPLGVITATLVIGLLRYPHLPAIMPVHFGLSGQPNGYAPKSLGTALSVVWIEILLTTLLTGIGYVILRSRQELDPAAPKASSAQHQVFQRKMVGVLLTLGFLANVTLLLSGLQMWGIPLVKGPAGPLVGMLPVLAGVTAVILVTLRVGQGGSRLQQPGEPATGFIRRDDDRYWRGGAIYVNREDPAIFVQRRFGVGWTLNFGHAAAWVLLAAIIAAAATAIILRRG